MNMKYAALSQEEKEDVLRAALEFLPDFIKNDAIVKKIIDDSCDPQQVEFSMPAIVVSKELLNKIITKYPEYKDYYNLYNNNDENISIIGYITFPYHVMIKKNMRNQEGVKYDVLVTKHLSKIEITMYENYNFIQEEDKTEDDITFEITDYKCSVGVFDHQGNEHNLHNKEELIDSIFADEFNVPMEFARFYRTMFKRFSKKLNVFRQKHLTDVVYGGVSDIYHYSFKEPMELDDIPFEMDYQVEKTRKELADLWEETSRKADEDYFEIFDRDYDPTIDYSEEEIINETQKKELPEEDRKKYNEKLKKVSLMFKQAFGTKGELVLSYELYNAIESYLNQFGMDILYGTGFAIKKEKDEFIFYTVKFDENQVFTFPKPITKEQLHEIINKSEYNLEIPELQIFAGLGDGRK